jgi:hypothetical protein
MIMEICHDQNVYMMAKFFRNVCDGSFREKFGRASSSVLVEKLFGNGDSEDANDHFPRVISRHLEFSERHVKDNLKGMNTKKHESIEQHYPNGIKRDKWQSTKQQARWEEMQDFFDEYVKVKSGHDYRYLFGTFQQNYNQYVQLVRLKDETPIDYRIWVEELKRQHVHKASDKDFVCPHCQLEKSTKKTEQKQYREHVKLWHTQKGKVSEWRELLR